jgi:hypothetical protein
MESEVRSDEVLYVAHGGLGKLEPGSGRKID